MALTSRRPYGLDRFSIRRAWDLRSSTRPKIRQLVGDPSKARCRGFHRALARRTLRNRRALGWSTD